MVYKSCDTLNRISNIDISKDEKWIVLLFSKYTHGPFLKDFSLSVSVSSFPV